MDTKAVEYHVRGILKAIGEDPDREGLRETPRRVAKMYEEVFEGTKYSNHEIAEMFGKTFASGDMEQAGSVVVMRDISVFSYCEHHMALMYDMHVSVAYIPYGRVLGLSKIARICDMAAKRLQLREVRLSLQPALHCGLLRLLPVSHHLHRPPGLHGLQGPGKHDLALPDGRAVQELCQRPSEPLFY